MADSKQPGCSSRRFATSRLRYGVVALLVPACTELFGDVHPRQRPIPDASDASREADGGVGATSESGAADAGGADDAVDVSVINGGDSEDRASPEAAPDPDARDDTGEQTGDTGPEARPGNVPPETVQDVSITVVEGTEDNSLQLPASDADGDPLAYRVVKQPTKGTVTITDAARGMATYASIKGQAGIDGFEYQVNDGENDAPVNGSVRVVVLARGPVQVATEDAHDSVLGIGVDVEGETALLGSLHPQPQGGAAYVARRMADGSWQVVQRLNPDQDDPVVARFGEFVALSGEWALVGAWGDWDVPTSPSGRAFFFKRGLDGKFHRAGTLATPSLPQPDRLGAGVKLSENWAAIGAVDGLTPTVRLYERGADDRWSFRQAVRSPEGSVVDGFGEHFDLEGDTLVVGASRDAEAGDEAGAAYVYVLRDSWELAKKLVPPAAGGQACAIVALSDGTVLCGAQQAASGRGAVYVFSTSDDTTNEVFAPVSEPGSIAFGRFVALDGNIATVVMRSQPAASAPIERVALVYRIERGDWTDVRRVSLGLNDGSVPIDGGLTGGFATKVAIDGTTIFMTNAFELGSTLVVNVPGFD